MIEVTNADGTPVVTESGQLKPFDFLTEVSINSSWEDLVSTGTLTLPKKIKIRTTGKYLDDITIGANPIFRRGQQIKISLGYDGNLTKRFEGIITKVSPKIPLRLTFEDDGFRLKQSICPKYSQTSGKISTILRTVLPIDPRTGKQYKFQTDDITVGKFTIEKASVMEFLNYLKQHFGFSVYFRDNTIFVGFAYTQNNIASFSVPNTPLNVFEFQRNIISDNLEYAREEDLRYKVTVVNIMRDNSRKTFDFGDIDGELRTFNFYDVPDADIKTMATNMLNRFKFTGFRGSFTAFLDPIVKHGDAIQLVDKIMPDRNGVYLVKRVVTTSGINGGRQVITLDRVITV